MVDLPEPVLPMIPTYTVNHPTLNLFLLPDFEGDVVNHVLQLLSVPQGDVADLELSLLRPLLRRLRCVVALLRWQSLAILVDSLDAVEVRLGLRQNVNEERKDHRTLIMLRSEEYLTETAQLKLIPTKAASYEEPLALLNPTPKNAVVPIRNPP